LSEIESHILISENEIAIRRREKMIAEIEQDHCKDCHESVTHCSKFCEYFRCLVGLNEKIKELKEQNEKLIKEKLAQDEI
jgi:hypothetical protein